MTCLSVPLRKRGGLCEEGDSGGRGKTLPENLPWREGRCRCGKTSNPPPVLQHLVLFRSKGPERSRSVFACHRVNRGRAGRRGSRRRGERPLSQCRNPRRNRVSRPRVRECFRVAKSHRQGRGRRGRVEAHLETPRLFLGKVEEVRAETLHHASLEGTRGSSPGG